MYGYSNRTTRNPCLPSPFAKNSMNGVSMPLPAPCASAMVVEASLEPSNRRPGSSGRKERYLQPSIALQRSPAVMRTGLYSRCETGFSYG
jgi:hypothetical protein